MYEYLNLCQNLGSKEDYKDNNSNEIIQMRVQQTLIIGFILADIREEISEKKHSINKLQNRKTNGFRHSDLVFSYIISLLKYSSGDRQSQT